MASTVSADSLWIRRYQRAAPGAAALVCLPHAGGNATFYFPMARAMAPHCEVLAIQYPGRQDRFQERVIDSIDELAERIFPVLKRNVGDAVALFGHSMGAILAFELARRFEAAGQVPLALFVSACPAPSRRRAGGTAHLGTDDELIANLLSLSGTGQPVLGNDQLLQLTLPAVRGDYKAAETYQYRPGPRLNCPTHAFLGDQDQSVTDGDAGAWAEHTRGAFAAAKYRGGHFYLTDHQAEILETVSAWLALP